MPSRTLLLTKIATLTFKIEVTPRQSRIFTRSPISHAPTPHTALKVPHTYARSEEKLYDVFIRGYTVEIRFFPPDSTMSLPEVIRFRICSFPQVIDRHSKLKEDEVTSQRNSTWHSQSGSLASRYHVIGPINSVYSEILLGRLCSWSTVLIMVQSAACILKSCLAGFAADPLC